MILESSRIYQNVNNISLHISQSVARPAIYALYFLTCYDWLRIIVVVIAPLLHKLFKTVVANLKCSNRLTYHIGATIFTSECCNLAKRCFIFTVVASPFRLNIIINTGSYTLTCTWLNFFICAWLLMVARTFLSWDLKVCRIWTRFLLSVWG
jgi:hypothetical protein